jgi:N-ethylmaleimide reductase
LLQVTKAAIEVMGSDRVGVRIAPWSRLAGKINSTPVETYHHVAEALEKMEIAYLHLFEPLSGLPPEAQPVGPSLRKVFMGPLMVNGGYELDSGNRAIASGLADMVAFGTLFLANPDLVERFRKRAPLNAPDRATFYTGGEKGYTDYPTLEG